MLGCPGYDQIYASAQRRLGFQQQPVRLALHSLTLRSRLSIRPDPTPLALTPAACASTKTPTPIPIPLTIIGLSSATTAQETTIRMANSMTL